MTTSSEVVGSDLFFSPSIDCPIVRTQKRPLCFSLDFEGRLSGDPDHLVSVCLQEVSRISLSGTVDLRTPLLVELKLEFQTLPPNLPSDIFPALKNLILLACNFQWESLPIRAGLKTLTISNPGSRISPEFVLDKLQVLEPTLEALTLYNTLLQFQTPATPDLEVDTTHPRQELSKVRAFQIVEEGTSSAFPIISVLERLSLPSRADFISVATYNELTRLETVEAGITIYMAEEGRIGVDDILPRSITLGVQVLPNLLDLIPVFDVLPRLPMRILRFCGNYLGDHTSALLAYLDAPGTIETVEVVRAFVPTFTSIMHNQNQQIRDIIGFKEGEDKGEDNQQIRDIIGFKEGEDKGEDVDEETKEKCWSVLRLHQLMTLKYFGHVQSDRGGLTGRDEGEEEEDGEGLTVQQCARILCDKEGRFSRQYFEVLGEWLGWRRVMGLGVKKLIFQDMNVPSKAYLEESYEGVDLEFINVVHVRHKTKKPMALPFKPNPNA
ncbi:hypothetical protein BDN72DRAFT_906313 [Pluteus cervinus]|uniref:Uncharacterized protein n=1 Tax=Pluteus cervinus TaxID=181527 RepID=A0ACD2ZZA7_9AGAR|nr:hypothetical protein BDN72DRAFT_906313 [Pluteus cervinus]